MHCHGHSSDSLNDETVWGTSKFQKTKKSNNWFDDMESDPGYHILAMASRLPQVARLILFTGPNCSLCDVSIVVLFIIKTNHSRQVAKSELVKVRQSVRIRLWSHLLQVKTECGTVSIRPGNSQYTR